MVRLVRLHGNKALFKKYIYETHTLTEFFVETGTEYIFSVQKKQVAFIDVKG